MAVAPVRRITSRRMGRRPMTQPEPIPQHVIDYYAGVGADMRAAAALFSHSIRSDHEGVRAVMYEAAERKRPKELVYALVTVARNLLRDRADDTELLAELAELSNQWSAVEINQEGN